MTVSLLQVGTLLAEKYRIERPLDGDHAQIFHAESTLGKRLTVQIFPQLAGAGPDVSSRWRRSLEAAARLRHPSSVRVYDFGLHGDTPFVVMEALEGEWFDAYLKRMPGPLPQTLDAIAATMVGVAEMHALGMVHGGLRPSQLVLSRSGDEMRPRYLPAVYTGALDQTIATGSFMSPEQVMGRPAIDHRTDVYAFGAILYQIIAGRPPFEASTWAELLLNIATRDPVAPRALPKDAHSERLDKLVLKALSKNPNDRPRDLSGLIDAARSTQRDPADSLERVIDELEDVAVVEIRGAFPAPRPEVESSSPLDRLKRAVGAVFGKPSKPAAPARQAPRPASHTNATSTNDPRNEVRFRASARRTVSLGSELATRFVAYPVGAQADAERLLQGVDALAEPRREYSEARWVLGTRATVTCRGEHLTVDPPSQELVWHGHPHALDFDVKVESTAPIPSPTQIKFDVSVEGITVARLRIALELVGAERATDNRAVAETHSARTAFASYASQDRMRVLDRVASVRTATGIDVWLDCADLRPNERWREKLAEEIVERDLFLLFWSKFAADSEWVAWEWRRALATKTLDAMQLHPLENPPVRLPSELSELHASDPLMDIREAAVRRG